MSGDSQDLVNALKQVSTAISNNGAESASGEAWLQSLKTEMEDSVRMISSGDER